MRHKTAGAAGIIDNCHTAVHVLLKEIQPGIQILSSQIVQIFIQLKQRITAMICHK